jgi:hypothetical protein
MANHRVLTTTNDPLLALTDRQKIFVDAVLRGQSQTMAARTAGYSAPNQRANLMMKDPKIIEALQQQHYKHEKSVQMTRKRVMEGLVEAIDMAKLQADPGTMVNGWREIGRMCGYYAAERKIIDVNISAKRVIDKLETLTDAELLEMVSQDEEAIEGEFEQVLVATQERADAEHALMYDEA